MLLQLQLLEHVRKIVTMDVFGVIDSAPVNRATLANKYTQRTCDHTKIKEDIFYNFNHYQVVQLDFWPEMVVRRRIFCSFILQYAYTLHSHTESAYRLQSLLLVGNTGNETQIYIACVHETA